VNSTRRVLLLLAAVGMLAVFTAPAMLAGTAPAATSTPKDDPAAELTSLLREQAAAWSRGDLDAFCSVYADDALFLTPTGTTRGRQAVLERYRKRYPDRAAMGTLTLEPIEVRLIGGESASVSCGPLLEAVRESGSAVAGASVAARWKLSYPDKQPAEGLTLIVFHRRDGRWWIVQDASM
jgi:uncharacterized protein (TIGR02246 family)